jgi:hypothetical protein
MSQPTMPPPPPAAAPPVTLLPILLVLLAAHRPAFGQDRPYQRCMALTLGHVCAFSRHTITQLLVALGLGGVDWSAFYRLFSVPRLNYDQLTTCFLRETLTHVPVETPYQVGLDGVQIPRSSQRLPGSSWLKAPRTPPWRPGIHRAQRFVHLAWLVPMAAASGYSRAIPLRLEAAFPANAAQARRAPIQPARREWEAGRDALVWLRAALDAASRTAQRIVAVADSAYGPACHTTRPSSRAAPRTGRSIGCRCHTPAGDGPVATVCVPQRRRPGCTDRDAGSRCASRSVAASGV